MTSSKPPTKSAGWGSLFSNAVANLESRLDVILADDADASARERAAEKLKLEGVEKSSVATRVAGENTPAGFAPGHKREGSIPRKNDRLAERLARATAQKTVSQNTSSVPSRVSTPVGEAENHVVPKSAESSQVEKASNDADAVVTSASSAVSNGAAATTDGSPAIVETETVSAANSALADPTRFSLDSVRSSIDVANNESLSRTSLEISAEMAFRPEKEFGLLTGDTSQPRESHEDTKQRPEDMHIYLEKIDALQAKLQYLANELVNAAKEANASAKPGSEQARLAEKDQQIAQLMEEGEKLSKTEMRHLQTIRKLRASAIEDGKLVKELKRKNEQSIRLENDLKHKLQRCESTQKQAEDKADQIHAITLQVDELKADREAASERIRDLTIQLKTAKARADGLELAQREASQAPSQADLYTIANLQNELEDAQIEKKLALDRATAEMKKHQEELAQQKQTMEHRELELKAEVSSLESRLETIRARVEEASSDAVSEGGSVKLIRQVETLQSQYGLAKENWEMIETSLNSRLSALEVERDESARREADLRKKHRDLVARCRKVEGELESAQEQSRLVTKQLQSRTEEFEALQVSHTETVRALKDARADLERHQKTWEDEVQHRLGEERLRLLSTSPRSSIAPPQQSRDSPKNSRNNSTTADVLSAQPMRKNGNRGLTQDPSLLDHMRPSNRRGSNLPALRNPHPSSISREQSPSISRQDSQLTMDLISPSIPATPSIEVEQDFDTMSVHRTINDLVSTSTAAAGPSVQLVERLSLAVRRLESEKATFKDELVRMATQRDDARNETVSLMREVETARSRIKLVSDAEDMRKRYEASLEMLGEREEEVQELKQDMAELKQMYKDLLEDKVGPAAR